MLLLLALIGSVSVEKEIAVQTTSDHVNLPQQNLNLIHIVNETLFVLVNSDLVR